jgi:hypothetical protein
MRVFWATLAVFLIVSAVVLWRTAARRGEAPPMPEAPAIGAVDAIEPAPVPPETSAPPPVPATQAAPVSPGVVDEETAKLIDELTRSAEARMAAEEAFGKAAPRLGEASPGEPTPGGAPTTGALAAITGNAADPPAATIVTPPSVAGAASAEPKEKPATGAAALENTVPSKIERRDDGSTVLDEQFVVRGSGSEEDPYEITWDLLVSCSETYQPRLGKLKIPQRVAMLNGTHVRITGYLGFPFAATEVKELLVMLNRWDGCCLGVPPSPYDGIEVRLARPFATRGGGHMIFNYGTIKGRLMVDPYLINEWLVGLYLMEDAELTMDL